MVEFAFIVALIVVEPLCALAMELIFQPLTFIVQALFAEECSVATGFPVLPLACVDVTIWVHHLPFALKVTVLCHPTIDAAILELDAAEPLPLGRLLFTGLSNILKLALIQSIVTDILPLRIPGVALTISVWIQLERDFLIGEELPVGVNDFSSLEFLVLD